MQADSKVCELTIPARADRLRIVRALVNGAAEYAGCGAEVAFEIVVAVNEACMNVIQHAYDDCPDGEIVLEIFNNDGQLTMRLTDFADPIDPDAVQPRDLNDLRPGGLGTHFIREVMDSFEIGRLLDGRGNFQEMKKKIA